MRRIQWRKVWRLAWAYWYAEIAVAIGCLIAGLLFITGVL